MAPRIRHFTIVSIKTCGIACTYPFNRSNNTSPIVPDTAPFFPPCSSTPSTTKICPKCTNGVPTAAGSGIRNICIPRNVTAAKKPTVTIVFKFIVLLCPIVKQPFSSYE
jgi:hypothetical protein